ncbi:unnamed protein product [Closterium sp. Naga37s-1]|nr:unnamed protein product [Closterium sp. Naga37s-1]
MRSYLHAHMRMKEHATSLHARALLRPLRRAASLLLLLHLHLASSAFLRLARANESLDTLDARDAAEPLDATESVNARTLLDARSSLDHAHAPADSNRPSAGISSFAGNGSFAGKGSCAPASASFSASASASSASASAPASALPVVVWHGFFDSCSNDKSVGYLRAAVRSVLPDVFFHSICVKEDGIRDISSSIFGSIDQQIDEVCASLAAIPQLARGFNAIGISQGGLLFRAYVQRCNSPPVRTLITLGSPHAGMAALPYCGPSREIKEELNPAGCTRVGDDDDVAANATSSASVAADWEGESTWQEEEGAESGGLSSLGGIGESALRVLASSSNGLSGFSGGLSGLSSGNSLSGFSSGLISFSGGISGGSFAGSSEIAGSVTWALLSGLGAAVDFCTLLKPHMHRIYQPWVQKFFMPAQFFRLWRHMDRYLQRSAFLADINNERGPTRRNETYAANVRSLDRLVLVRWQDETMISPPQSSWFWSHDRFGNLLPLQEQPMFAEDWLGLRTLHEKKKLHFTTMPGSHGIINPSLFAREFVSKYLVPEPTEAAA